VVRDTGVGIPADELPRVSERFHRIEGQRGRTHEGSGIGLALVDELVRLHGGRIGVSSVPGRSTEFRVTIPLGTARLPPDRIQGARGSASTAVRASAYVEEALAGCRTKPRGDRKSPGGTGRAWSPSRAGRASSSLTTTPTCGPTWCGSWSGADTRWGPSGTARRRSPRRAAGRRPT
jgi:hypothetical protein